MTTNAATVELVGTRQVLHRANTMGPRITEVQTVRASNSGHRYEVDLWHDENGRLVRVGEPRMMKD